MGYGLSDEVWSAIRGMGVGATPDINKGSKQLFAPLIERGEGVRETFDVAYGPHPRQKLDVYRGDEEGCPVVIYIPGGGFLAGDKRQDETYFANVGRFFAARGAVGITANYRLAPEFKWPSAAQDVGAVVAWARANAAAHGGDPERVVLFGHSAGAAHVASYLFDPDLRGFEHVRGAALASGVYALRASELRPNVVSYFGDDESTFERRSALTHVAASRGPLMLAVAEYDPPELAVPTFELAAALTRRDGHPPPIMRLDGHNHFSAICSIGTADERLSGALLSFVINA